MKNHIVNWKIFTRYGDTDVRMDVIYNKNVRIRPCTVKVRPFPIVYDKNTIVYDRKHSVYDLCFSWYTVTEIYDRITGPCNTVKYSRIRSVYVMYTVVYDRIRSP